MAKMFYNLEEAAQRLGVSQEKLQEMGASGELQQFRDRDKVMFKREQIDSMAQGGADGGGASGSEIPLADESDQTSADQSSSDETQMSDTEVGGTSMGMSGMGDTDQVSLSDSGETQVDESQDSREATGISVFEAGEVEPTDPMAQTQVTGPNIDDEELALESVGSGSGLLDLTRESDDTSLGAELLDEIYPGPGEGGAASSGDFNLESSAGGSGVFEGGLSSMESGTSGGTALGETRPGSVDALTAGSEGPATSTYVDESDPAGSALGAGLLAGATLALIIALAVVVAALAGSRSTITSMFVEGGDAGSVMYLALGLLVLCGLLGGVGYAVGKNSAS